MKALDGLGIEKRRGGKLGRWLLNC
jgi:hypothetical protein